MPLDPSTVGYTTKPHAYTYDWRTLATYALGIGAKRDELDYLYENAKNGMKVYPTFAVVPAFPPVVEMLARTGGDMAMVVHGGQTVHVHRAIPASGTLQTTGTIKAMYDLKKFGQVVVETNTTIDGAPLFDTVWSIIYRGHGSFGGPRPPAGDIGIDVPESREPDWNFEEATSPEQALLYRISGDTNPLHADPEFAAMVGFPQGPILHGLATYGFAGRALVRGSAGGDATRVRSFGAQFRKPVWPGEVIETKGWNLEGGKVAMLAYVKGRPEPVLTSTWAILG